MGKTKASVYMYIVDGKEVAFVPMHHLGKQEFYDDVAKLVKQYKANGYTVYYELISTNFTQDSILKDTIRRKARKIKGFNGTYKDNAEGSFKKYVQQPAYKDLGITESDVRADVDYLQLINQFEKLYGPIVLDSTDMHTSFDVKFSKSELYGKQQYTSVIVNYRNDNLIAMIRESKQPKILVLYGEGHRKDFVKKTGAK